MRKEKNTELNFLYMDEKQTTKKKKTTKLKNAINAKNKNMSKSKKKNVGADSVSAQENNTFNFDNEIVIGVTKLPDINKNSKAKNSNSKSIKSRNKEKPSKNISSNNSYNKNVSKRNFETRKKKNTKLNNVKNKEKYEELRNTKRERSINENSKNSKRKNNIIKGIIKWTILLCALIAAFIYFMMSPLFNLAEIQVVNNEKISTDTIISLSKLTIGENIYKTSINNLKKNIKQNAYIESVDIKRKLPNKILITVKERKATFNLEYANSFAYINNQGYILDILEDKLEVPIIEGYTTTGENIIVGNRLNDEDLEKLGTVLKIMESANVNEIGNLITKINISDKQNYTLVLEGEKKRVYLGDSSNLSTRMLYLKAILAEERGIEGEIFINVDLNKSNIYFRRKE